MTKHFYQGLAIKLSCPHTVVIVCQTAGVNPLALRAVPQNMASIMLQVIVLVIILYDAVPVRVIPDVSVQNFQSLSVESVNGCHVVPR